MLASICSTRLGAVSLYAIGAPGEETVASVFPHVPPPTQPEMMGAAAPGSAWRSSRPAEIHNPPRQRRAVDLGQDTTFTVVVSVLNQPQVVATSS